MRPVPPYEEQLEVTMCLCGTVSLRYGALRATFTTDEFFAFANKMAHLARIVTTCRPSSRLSSTVWN